ncbi:MAG: YceI family protein [Chloroflexota bacterium]
MRKTTGMMIALLILTLSACAAPAEQPAPTAQPALPTAMVATAAQPAVMATPTSEPATAPAPGEPAPAGEAEQKTFRIVAGESTVTYEVGETFLNQNNRFAVAIGVTTQVTGEVNANLANPPASSIGVIEVDISQFKSDSSRRDSAIQNQWLESARYPIARFEPVRIEGLPESYSQATPYAFRVIGNLTVRETTREVTFDISARLDGDTLSGSATTTLLMSDFEVGPISIGGILNTEDEVKLTFDFVARP